MKRLGFSLIELAIAIALSTLLSTVLYQIFKHVNRTVTIIDTRVDYVRAVSRFLDIFEQDISAAFLETKDSKDKKIERPFYVQREQNRFTLFTFLTTHHVGTFGELVPDRVRVVYRMKDMGEGLAKITRQESDRFDLKEFEGTKIRAYDIIERIKDLSLTFIIEEKGEKPTYREVAEWPPASEKKEESVLPRFVIIKGMLVDHRMHEYPFEHEMQIYSEPLAEKPSPAQDLKTTGTPSQQPPPVQKGGL